MRVRPTTRSSGWLTFFNGHYDSWCDLPLLAFLTFDREREHLCAAVLRPGNVPATRGTVGVLCRLLPLLRQAFPQARFLVRLDGGFATPEIFDFLDAEPRLLRGGDGQERRVAAPRLAQAQRAASGQTAHVYTDTQYQAGTWGHARRVVIKAEVVRLGDREPRDNPRFVVTNLRQTPRYEKVYCARGTYPGFFPILHLDHIYYQGQVDIMRVQLPRTRKTLVASDHLPLVADLRVTL